MSTRSITTKSIAEKIFHLRGYKVILDNDLAQLYGVSTKRLNEQAKRNKRRFPKDFMFQLTQAEHHDLRSHFATLNKGSQRGRHTKYLPYAFSEHGTVMVANILNSNRAIDTSVIVVRTFIQLRSILADHKNLLYKLEQLEQRMDHKDREVKAIFETIRRLMTIGEKPIHKIGFHAGH